MAKLAVKEDDADVIIIGGTAFSCIPGYEKLRHALKELGVPVLCGGDTAFKVAEVLFIRCGSEQEKVSEAPGEREVFLDESSSPFFRKEGYRAG